MRTRKRQRTEAVREWVDALVCGVMTLLLMAELMTLVWVFG